MRFERWFLLAALSLGAVACEEKPVDIPDTGVEMDAGAVADNCTNDMPCVLTSGMTGMDYVAPINDEDPWTINVTSPGTVMQIVAGNDAEFSPIRLEVVLFDPTGASIRNERFQGNGKQ